MRLIHLTVQAFGPFPHRETIDFASLAAAERFLIDGPTGVGKTTIIDAITYALYSGISGEDASGGRLRCTYANPFDPTEVDLVFSVSSGTWRIMRSPAYERPKKRGEGTTSQPASQTLWRWEGPADDLTVTDSPHWQVVASKANEIGSLIPQIIGLNREQFLQTIVLPQGRFATFLRASSLDRRHILTTIFGTGAFEVLEDKLAAEARDAQRVITQEADAVLALLTRLHELARDHAEHEAAALASVSTSAADDPAALASGVGDATEALLSALDQVRAETAKASTAARAGLKKANTALAKAEKVAELRALHARRSSEARQLDEASEEIASITRRLSQAEAAGALMRVRKAYVKAQDASELSIEKAAAARAKALKAADGLDEKVHHGIDHGALASELSTYLTETIAQFAPALTAETSLASAQREYDTAVKAVKTTTEELAALRAERAELTASREKCAPLAEGYDQARDNLNRAQVALDKASMLTKAAKKWASAQKQVEEKAADLDQAVQDAAKQAHAAETLTARWTAAVAARLATELEDDQPCPVCGSLSHPAPAMSHADTPSDEAVEAAQEASRSAGERVAELTATLKAAKEKAAADAEAADHTSSGEAKAAEKQARSDLKAAEKAATEATQAREQLKEIDAKVEELAPQELTLSSSLATCKAQEKTAGLKLGELSKVIEEARAGFASVKKRVNAYETLRKRVDELEKCESEREKAREFAAQSEGECATVLAESDFPDWDAVAGASVSQQVRTGWSERIDEHKRLRAIVTYDLAREDVREAAAGPEPDLEKVREVAKEAEERATLAGGKAETAAGAAERAHNLAKEVTEKVGDLDLALTRGGTVARLAKLARGETSAERIPLSTFVLLRNFEIIIAAANDHLGPMCENRYELVYSPEEKSTQARRHGLGLLVIDHHDGSQRATTTLSGGETFYVSLSLALGLADVVRSVSGGVELGTLFVDEGFGSLDEDTLGNVLETLTTTAGQGRFLGIISHVEDLKTVIPDRIKVRRLPGQAGSTLEVVTD